MHRATAHWTPGRATKQRQRCALLALPAACTSLQIVTIIIIITTLIINSSSIADNSQQAAQAPSSYQGIFEIHEPSVIHGEPSLLEFLCLLKSQKMPDHTQKQHSFSLTRHDPGVSKHLEEPDGLGELGTDGF